MQREADGVMSRIKHGIIYLYVLYLLQDVISCRVVHVAGMTILNFCQLQKYLKRNFLIKDAYDNSRFNDFASMFFFIFHWNRDIVFSSLLKVTLFFTCVRFSM